MIRRGFLAGLGALFSSPALANFSFNWPSWGFSVAGFSPANIANLVLWLDADDAGTITLNSGNVAQWDDKSGLDNHAVQGTEGNQPPYIAAPGGMNGLAEVDFDSDATHGLESPADASISNIWASGGYLAIVVRRDSGTATRLMQNDTGWLIRVRTAADDWEVYFSAIKTVTNGQWETQAASKLSIDTVYIIEITYNSDADTNTPVVVINNVAHTLDVISTPASGDQVDDSADALSVGNSGGLNDAFDGVFGEVILYSTVPSTAEKSTLRTHLADKWGVSL